MKALVFTAPGRLELLEVPAPEPLAGELEIEVAAAGICGSDLHGIREVGFRRPPLVLGHELAGLASDGRRVVVNPLLSCGACSACRRGQTELCAERQLIGVHRQGGFAERIAVPAAAVRELPGEMSFEQAAMIEPLANAVHAWALAGAPAGARVGILGAGTIGLVCLLLAARRGAGPISVADPAAERRQLAGRLGASETGAELAGEFDVIVDAVGIEETRRASVAALRPGGTAVWLGLLDGAAGFDAKELVRTEKRVLGSFAYTGAEFDEALALGGGFDLDWSHSFPLSDGWSIFSELMNGRADVVKALLTP